MANFTENLTYGRCRHFRYYSVISFAGDSSDSITLVGVHASALHSTDFQLV